MHMHEESAVSLLLSESQESSSVSDSVESPVFQIMLEVGLCGGGALTSERVRL